jgi:hypothetical protein
MMLLVALLLSSPDRTTIGVFESWGAFAGTGPRRCYAMAAPVQQRRVGFVAVTTWPNADPRPQLHVRLSRAHAAASRVTLAIGERRFRLTAGPRDAWAPDAETDRAIVAAMRGARSLSVESVGADRRPFADVYRLSGAATAIDAARVACLG